MSDWERAKERLQNEGRTCVVCKGEQVYSSDQRGVAPLLEWISDGVELRGFSAADKVVGKAAALLFALAGVRQVYAPVMSEAAVHVFSRQGIQAVCDRTVPTIINRAGDGPCPMEQAVRDIDDPQAAFHAVRNKMEQLRAGR